MNEYKDLEDSLYNVIEEQFPDWTIIFAYGNGPEPVTPVCIIDVMKWQPIGQPYTSHLGEVVESGNTRTMTVQDVITTVRFEVSGKADLNTRLSEMAHSVPLALRSPKGYESLSRNRLSLHGRITTRRIPVKRDTDTYMCYQVDCMFAYCSVTTDENDWIAVTGIDGVYRDAGRLPDHIINTHIDIETQP